MATKLTQRLYVFLPARRDWPGGARGTLGPATTVSWLAVGDDGSARGERGAIANLPKSRRVDLVFDSRDVFAATIPAPKLAEAKLRQALPNLLEDRLLADPTDLHFAFQLSDTALSVCAIDRATLARALEAFAQAQIAVRAAYSTIYTIPPPADDAVALRVPPGDAQRDLHGTLRTDRDQGISLALDETGAPTLALLQRRRPFTRLRAYGAVPDTLRARAPELGIAIEACGIGVDAQNPAEAVNLLQGSYAVGGGIAGRWADRLLRGGAWQAPAAWAAGCADIAIIGLNATWLKLDAQVRDLRQSIRHAFRDGFPQETTVIDEVLQARRDVTSLSARAGIPSPDDFPALDAQAAQLLAEAPVGIVSSIAYSHHAYTVHFRAGALSATLRNALEARAGAQGLALRFESGDTLRIAPRGTLSGSGA